MKKLGNIAVLCFVVVLVSSAAKVPNVLASSNPTIVLSPESGNYAAGQEFTLIVNLTNAHDLFFWEVVLKYDTTILNLTSVWIPDDNVFAGHVTIAVEPITRVDSNDGMSFTDYGLSLIGVDEIATVTNAVLFNANFTVVGVGEGRVTTATIGTPAMSGFTPLYSFIGFVDQYGNLQYFQDFTVGTCTINQTISEFHPIVILTTFMIVVLIAVIVCNKKRWHYLEDNSTKLMCS